MTERLLTPSKITAWLDCGHFLTLQHREDAGLLQIEGGRFGALAKLLMDKGLSHESACLDEYRAKGKSVFEVPARSNFESFSDWVARVGNPLADGHDVIYQMPFVRNGIRGIADFLIRVDGSAEGFHYEPVDAKLARAEAKPGHVLQLCFYADAIEALTGSVPIDVHIWLGSGHVETIRLADVRAYWRRLRHQLARVMESDIDETTEPEQCAHCGFCRFADHCENHWRSQDSLIYVAGIRSADQTSLKAAGVSTLAELGALKHAVAELDESRSQRLTQQAALQVQARSSPDAIPPFLLLNPGDPTAEVTGFAAMPMPDAGDVYLDYEGHPFWRADRGLFFLFGLLTHDSSNSSPNEMVYEERWAHDVTDEGVQTSALIEYLAARRQQYPGMHVYHYNHTERSSLERLAAEHGVGEDALAELIDGGLFVDLLAIVRQSVLAGVESYGLKHIEQLAGYQRSHDIDEGAGAVVEYEAYMADGSAERLDRIAIYNADDVRATHALHGWLIAQRDGELPWRVAFVGPAESAYAEINAQVVALHEFPADSVEHLLGDVLGYWRREGRVDLANALAKLSRDPVDRHHDTEVITDLRFAGDVERFGTTGRVLASGKGFSFPAQSLASKFSADRAGVLYTAGAGLPGYAGIDQFDEANCTIALKWNDKNNDLGVHPTAVVLNNGVNAKPKPQALSALATELLTPDSPTPLPRVGVALLRGDPPAFSAGNGPLDGTFTDDLASILTWVPHLSQSVVAIQGPPGTGKTYTGAHIVLELVRRNKRVGITAMSHAAINNLLREVVNVFEEAGELDLLRAVRRGPDPEVDGLERIEYASKNPPCANPIYNVIAGTTWLFAGADMCAVPVDVMLIDEAGQLALADALAASMSAGSLVLLGDPNQLAQVSKASHPAGSGASVLEHVLAGSVTIPPDRGVFLAETRRMHPDICQFISEQIYDGRLTSHASCSNQQTHFGTGLRWLRAHHQGCSTSSVEEATLVHDRIAAQIGSSWTDPSGSNKALTTADYMVVAPYNDQVAVLRSVLDSDPLTFGVRVGTVDKFQGQEAPIVFFTMTASTAADIPRGPEFLFSKNRLNVAISRARCLAYLVCTDQLLDSRARDVDAMKLIATLCSFVESAEPAEVPDARTTA